ncbi:RNA-binding protein [Pseudomonas abyssi]|jgi:ribosome-associated heat shock protein Hsp15|uniref:Heat shock protein 15 n=1 Tax=Pseudomonas abyssi TaxID=170540 RepID=A0A2A3MK85_9PSED|nr:RNA-binding S4 domain-containing protein [Pseudomonas abyssi]MAC98343.1 RNA-binding protein [Pseudomonadales bacterium]PBK05203.1 RNA-binding protein [Pseudomonas abyssi]|tara:strand:+ start:43964 stop:44371 length:408 start_codon:yes stop_codon:yes gene_type:complete
MQDVGKLRLDKWLWAARFFKTRSLAKSAIEGGKVHCGSERCKASKEIRVGDQLQIRQGLDQRSVEVLQLSDQRRGAPEAQLLYRESAESIAAREAAAAQRKAQGAGGLISDGRPSKKQRRQIFRFRDERNTPSAD